MRRWLTGLVVLATLFTAALAWGLQEQEPEPQEIDERQAFMQRKLDDARQIVEGLAMEDYRKISVAADDLIRISHESGWNTLTSEAYLQLSSEFRSSSSRLRKMADEENLDGATLAFFEVTMNCVRCHKFVRQQK